MCQNKIWSIFPSYLSNSKAEPNDITGACAREFAREFGTFRISEPEPSLLAYTKYVWCRCRFVYPTFTPMMDFYIAGLTMHFHVYFQVCSQQHSDEKPKNGKTGFETALAKLDCTRVHRPP